MSGPYLPTIKSYTNKYEKQVRSLTMNLEKFYPLIGVWLEGEMDKLNKGIDQCLMVVDGNDHVGGIAISGLENSKDEGLVKLKTFYLEKDFEGYAIGVWLLKEVLNFWMQKRIRRIFVTFAEEELNELRGFFDTFGFVMDGIGPQQYRLEKTEYFMSKTFMYRNVNESSFVEFSRNYLFRMRGIIPKSDGADFIAHEDNRISKTPRNVLVKIIVDKKPNTERLIKELKASLVERKCTYAILASYYPLKQIDDEQIKVIDGCNLEHLFYPFELDKAELAGVILPIEPKYSRLLVPDPKQSGFSISKIALRKDKVYWTGKIFEMNGAIRGNKFIFYETDTSQIIGEATINRFMVDTPEVLSKQFLLKGVLSQAEINELSREEKVGIYWFGNIKRYKKSVSIDDVKKVIVNFNPQFGNNLTQRQIYEIRSLAGSNDFFY